MRRFSSISSRAKDSTERRPINEREIVDLPEQVAPVLHMLPAQQG